MTEALEAKPMEGESQERTPDSKGMTMRSVSTSAAMQSHLSPAMELVEMQKEMAEIKKFISSQLVEDTDYGIIPGTGNKKTLFKPGAEKMANFFGLREEFEDIDVIEDFEKPFFRYRKRCKLYRIFRDPETKQIHKVYFGMGEGEANSYESKWRYRWFYENQIPQGMDKKEMPTKRRFNYKKKSWDTQYRADNDEIHSQVNTIIKMANKRCYLDAVLRATRTSEWFTQDMDDDDAPISEPVQKPSRVPQKPVSKPASKPSPGGSSPAPSGADATIDQTQQRILRTRAFAVAREQVKGIKPEDSAKILEDMIKSTLKKDLDKLTKTDMSKILEAMSGKNDRKVDFKAKVLKV